MAAAIGVRTDQTSPALLGFARRCSDRDHLRRLMVLASILDGGRRSNAAKLAGLTLQVVRDWVLRFNEGGPDDLPTRKAPGRASTPKEAQHARLARRSRPGRSLLLMALYAGGLLISRTGSGMSSRFP